jgi:hypothetical protein
MLATTPQRVNPTAHGPEVLLAFVVLIVLGGGGLHAIRGAVVQEG